MKALVIGSGGREHALAWKLSQECHVIAIPGNPGISEVAKCLPPAADFHELARIAIDEEVDLAVVGPEDPLIQGCADVLRSQGILTFGPGADGAKLEGSKAFSKELMRAAGVPTAEFQVFTDAGKAHDYASAKGGGRVVKASGAALGKGVIVADREEEVHDAIDAMLVDRVFGKSGETIVIEDRLRGREFSLLTLCSDGDILSLPVAQDYKRALDGDRGPNTGGMGTYSPVPWITPDTVAETERRVVKPVLAALRSQGISYRGVLYSGMMLNGEDLNCLEFNVRFGDPEIQTVVRRLGSGFAAALLACAQGASIPPVEVSENSAVSVVVASGGYPGNYEKGKVIRFGEVPDGVVVFHAGTSARDGDVVTSSGRVVAVSAAASDLSMARALAYAGTGAVRFEGMYCRSDIAAL